MYLQLYYLELKVISIDYHLFFLIYSSKSKYIQFNDEG